MWVWKIGSVGLKALQARRIDCEHCEQPFTYLHVEPVQVAEKEFAFWGAETVKRRAAAAAGKALQGLAQPSHRGDAVCPNCLRRQSWMLTGSRASALRGALLGLLLAGLSTGALSVYAAVTHTSPAPVGWILLAAIVLGAALGRKTAVGPATEYELDPRAKSDDQFTRLLGRTYLNEALKGWHRDLVDAGCEPYPEVSLISVGVQDLANVPLRLPPSFTTASVLQRRKAEVARAARSEHQVVLPVPVPGGVAGMATVVTGLTGLAMPRLQTRRRGRGTA